jgi:hypothetical protein
LAAAIRNQLVVVSFDSNDEIGPAIKAVRPDVLVEDSAPNAPREFGCRLAADELIPQRQR